MKFRLKNWLALCPVLLAALLVIPATSAGAQPSVSIGNTSVLAGPTGTQHAVFPVTLSVASGSVVTVGYGTADGTANAGTDYTATSGTLTVPAGSMAGSIGVPVAGGQNDASGLTFTVTLANAVNAALGTATGTATITHDAAPVAVSVAPSTLASPVNVAELLTTTCSSVGGTANLTGVGINLGKLSSPATSLYGKFVPATGLFYLANASGTYVGGFAAGSANTIATTLGSLNLAGTTVAENGNQLVIGWDLTPAASLIGAQNLYLDASDSFGLSSGWQSLGSWTVSTAASIGNASVLTGPSGSPHATFTVTLSSASPSSVSLSYSTANGTASAGTDYTATSGTLVIPAGGTTGTISVPVASGQTDASGLTFTVTLSNPVNAILATATGTVTIIHDAAPVAVSVTPDPAASAVGAPELLTTTTSSVGGASNFSSVGLNIGKLSSPASSLYAKYVASSQVFYLANASGSYIGGYAAGSANTITTTLGTLNLAGTTVSQNGNQLVIGWDFTPTASLTGAQNVYLIASDNFGLSSGWQDLDTWTVFTATAASINNAAVLTGPTGSPHAVFTVTLSAASQFAVSLHYATSNGTAFSGTDYTATSGSLTFPAGSTNATITVPVASGQTDASGLTFTVTLSNPVNATIGTGTGTATITHDTAPAAVSVTVSPATSPVTAPQLFTATYSSVGGASNLAVASLNLGKLTTPASSVYAKYVPSSQLFYVANASGTYIGGYAAGSANTITTTMGTLNLAATTVTVNGNQLVIGWDFTPTASLIGTQNVYLLASDVFGLSSGWQNLGTWTVTAGPDNDNFASAQAITGVSGSVLGSTFGATVESGEPNLYGSTRTVWYAYTAPSSSAGSVTFLVNSSGAYQGADIYTGTALSNLDLVGTPSLPCATTAGTTLFVQVGLQASAPSNFSLAWDWAPAPGNDNFANAQAISGVSGSVTGTSIGASSENGEPAPGGDYLPGTVWYAYTAPSGPSGSVTFTLANYSEFQYVYVYTGTSVSGLTQVGGGLDGYSFVPVAGATYSIQIAGFEGTPGSFTLIWSWGSAPANDNFANAQVISGASGSANGTTVGATLESGETNYPGGNSVWYSYTAPSGTAGTETFSLTNYVEDLRLYVYTGTSLSNLVLVTGVEGGQSFQAVPGTEYWVRVASWNSVSPFTLHWSAPAAPGNDDFANATAIAGASGTLNGVTSGASSETGEPNLTQDETVWYQFTEPSGAAGTASFNTSAVMTVNGQYVTLADNLHIYTGTALGNLTLIGSNTISSGASSPAVFATSPGEVCYVQVEGSATTYPGTFTLTWSWAPAPGNDDFANAQALSGASGSVAGTTAGASTEASEPNASGVDTVWYSYSAPAEANGVSFVATNDADRLYVYSGTALSSLTQIAGGGVGASFSATPGATYWIQLESGLATTGAFTLNWASTAAATAPPNDNFASAQLLSGQSGSVAGSTVGATAQSGEPHAFGYFGSVWYQWTPAESAPPFPPTPPVTFALSGNGVAQGVYVYTGSSVSGLNEITGGTNSASFLPIDGTTYYIQVVEAFTGPSGFTLGWSNAAPPANDDFASAQPIAGASGSVNGTTVGSTEEAGEPNVGEENQSVWYAYTAPSGTVGNVTLSTSYSLGQAEGTEIQVYTGSGLNSLQGVTWGQYSASFTTAPGVTYYIQLESDNNFTNAFTLNWSWIAVAGIASYSGPSGSFLELSPVRKVSSKSS